MFGGHGLTGLAGPLLRVFCQEDTPMTRDEICAAAQRLWGWHGRFAPLFGRKKARAHSFEYVRGLMANQERKSVEPIALRFGENPEGGMPAENEVVALQGFLRDSPWEAGDVFREIQAVFAEELVPSAAGSPIGTVGVIGDAAKAAADRYCNCATRTWDW